MTRRLGIVVAAAVAMAPAHAARATPACSLTLAGDPCDPLGAGEARSDLGLGLDEKAIEAVRNWKFEPALKDGKPVAVQINVEVNFRLY